MTWLRDIVRALQHLGGEGRWTDIVQETYNIRMEKNEHISQFSTLRMNFVLNENRDGCGKDIFTRPARGIYRLKVPEGQRTLDDIILDAASTVEDNQLLTDLEDRLQELQAFSDLISEESASETKAGNYLKESPWILDLEYQRLLPEERIGLNGRTDFLVEKVGGDFDIIELKGPRDQVFVKSKSNSYFRMSAQCKDSISQMMNYLSRYDIYYLFQREETTRDVLYPTGTIVIGLNKETDPQSLIIHNNFLHRLQLRTYDDIIESCRRSVENLRKEIA